MNGNKDIPQKVNILHEGKKFRHDGYTKHRNIKQNGLQYASVRHIARVTNQTVESSH